ncbi:hypothetical protein Q8A67_009321 [Cirrhinus molitorella]|uniref:Neuronal tyrosine-phosphorylated phosphoinositide-3-kinase adapter 2 n=1 Tax=Cirrhinus molitorella TaxID=172907 RepID=A0AA88TT69_9TELE|nr:hypothetical protein Q8A67_009321 [Cirrhinus molitorella]
MWNEKNWINFQDKINKKQKQEEAIKRGEEVIEGKHLQMGSMSMPAPAEHMSAHQQKSPCNPGFAVRSQSLHSVEEGEEQGSPTSRKQPPPKPRRDPNTKLSISSEAVDLSPTECKGDNSERCDGTQGCSEDCRKVPPPKPKRNPNTQLSTSFDESYIRNHGSKDSSDDQAPSPPQPQDPQDSDLDEPIYIEMSGNVGREPTLHPEEDEPGEAVYEEMKYPVLDEFDFRWDLSSCRSQCVTPCTPELDIHVPLSRCTTPRGTPVCDIPAPFPNLLTHRPPLLVFPPAPAQCSPNSDESPLTPLDVAKLLMLENDSFGKSPTSSSLEPSGSASMPHLRRAERELTTTPTITVSGRSSAPPLPCALYKNSSSSHSYQRSHSACPSPVSMGRCLTPLSLMRSPPFDGPFPTAGIPRSSSATPHGKGSPPQDASSGGRHHGSMQNVSVARSRTPTSPLDELTNLFTTGRNMLKKNNSGRKSKEPGEIHTSDTFPYYDEKVRSDYSIELPKTQDTDTRPGSSAIASSIRSGRSSMSPNIILGNLKMAPKTGQSSSTTVAPSPKGTPQRQLADVQQMPPMPWLYSDSTMLEMIERKQRLCWEIRSRQRLPDRSPCTKESLPTMPSWKKTNGANKHSPPPYPTQTTVFWDTAI